MKLTLKALDHYDALQAGHTYELSTVLGGRMIQCVDRESGRLVSLYDWQIKDGTLRGKLEYVDSTQSAAMSCSAVSTLCKRLDSNFIY